MGNNQPTSYQKQVVCRLSRWQRGSRWPSSLDCDYWRTAVGLMSQMMTLHGLAVGWQPSFAFCLISVWVIRQERKERERERENDREWYPNNGSFSWILTLPYYIVTPTTVWTPFKHACSQHDKTVPTATSYSKSIQLTTCLYKLKSLFPSNTMALESTEGTEANHTEMGSRGTGLPTLHLSHNHIPIKLYQKLSHGYKVFKLYHVKLWENVQNKR